MYFGRRERSRATLESHARESQANATPGQKRAVEHHCASIETMTIQGNNPHSRVMLLSERASWGLPAPDARGTDAGGYCCVGLYLGMRPGC